MQTPEMEKQKGRVLFTGCADRVVDNLIEHLPVKHEMKKCAPNEMELRRTLESLRPQILIVCLQKETWDMLRIYDLFYNETEHVNLPVIVLGHEEDCRQFKRRLPLRRLELFIRPLDQDALVETIDRLVALVQEEEQENLRAQEEDAKSQAAAAKAPQTGDADSDFDPDLDLELDPELSPTEKALHKRIERGNRINGRKHILVVDDDVRMLKVIKLYLQDLYHVTLVPSGKLALKFLSKKSVDLVLLDYMMPELDGPDVLRQIRTTSPYPHVPVVFLTGVSDKESVVRGLEFRPNAYMLKPVVREALLEKVTEIVLEI